MSHGQSQQNDVLKLSSLAHDKFSTEFFGFEGEAESATEGMTATPLGLECIFCGCALGTLRTLAIINHHETA